MATIIQNIEEYQSALKAVEAHCMCAKIEDAGEKIIVYYPEGDFRTGGLRIDRNAAMLRKALEIMERDWLASFPGGI